MLALTLVITLVAVVLLAVAVVAGWLLVTLLRVAGGRRPAGYLRTARPLAGAALVAATAAVLINVWGLGRYRLFNDVGESCWTGQDLGDVVATAGFPLRVVCRTAAGDVELVPAAFNVLYIGLGVVALALLVAALRARRAANAVRS